MTYPDITEGLRVQYRAQPKERMMGALTGQIRFVGTVSASGYTDMLDENGNVMDTRSRMSMQPTQFWRDFEPVIDMDDERRAVLKRLQGLNPPGLGTGNPSYSTDVLKGICDLLEGRTEQDSKTAYLKKRTALAAVIKEAREKYYEGVTNWGLPYDVFVAERVLEHLEDES